MNNKIDGFFVSYELFSLERLLCFFFFYFFGLSSWVSTFLEIIFSLLKLAYCVGALPGGNNKRASNKDLYTYASVHKNDSNKSVTSSEITSQVKSCGSKHNRNKQVKNKHM